METGKRPVVLYDDGCRFCIAMAKLAMRWDRRKRLAFLPWSDERAQEWMAALDPEVRDATMHIKLRDGRLLSGPGTFAVVLSFLPGMRWLGRLGRRNKVAGKALGKTYKFVARRRGTLSKLVPGRGNRRA